MWFVYNALFVAHAGCPYTLDDLVTDLSSTEEGLRSGDAASASEGAAVLEEGLGCLDTNLSTALTGRLYRSLGAGLVSGESYERGVAWLATALELEPGYVFGVDELAENHPALAAFEAAEALPAASPEPVPDRVLSPGIWRLDGRILNQPTATIDRPHVLQRTLDGGVSSWVIEGNTFPAQLLTAPVVVENKVSKQPKTKSKRCKGGLRMKSFIDAEGNYCPATPPEQVILVLSGPLVLGAAGGLYLESFRQKKLASSAQDLASLEKHRALNNRVYVASLGTAAVGVGLGVFGVTYTGTF